MNKILRALFRGAVGALLGSLLSVPIFMAPHSASYSIGDNVSEQGAAHLLAIGLAIFGAVPGLVVGLTGARQVGGLLTGLIWGALFLPMTMGLSVPIATFVGWVIVLILQALKLTEGEKAGGADCIGVKRA